MDEGVAKWVDAKKGKEMTPLSSKHFKTIDKHRFVRVTSGSIRVCISVNTQRTSQPKQT